MSANGVSVTRFAPLSARGAKIAAAMPSTASAGSQRFVARRLVICVLSRVFLTGYKQTLYPLRYTRDFIKNGLNLKWSLRSRDAQFGAAGDKCLPIDLS